MSQYASGCGNVASKGDETSADAADPAANPVILTGDVYHDNYWRVKATGASVGAVIDYENLVFNEPQPADRETYWAANGNNGDDSPTAFAGETAITNCVLEGLVITCFKETAIRTSEPAGLKLVKCRILADNTGINGGAERGAVVIRGDFEATDCDFWAMHTPLTVLDGGAGRIDPIRLTRCSFRLNHGSGSGTGGGFSMDSAGRDLIIEGCEFTDNFVWEYQGYQRCPVQIQNSKRFVMRDTLIARNTYKNRCVAAFDIENAGNGLEIERCVIRDNWKIGVGSDSGKTAAALRIVMIKPWNSQVVSVIRDTIFEGNRVIRQNESNNGTPQVVNQASALRHSYGPLTIINCSFVGNETDMTGAADGSRGSTVALSGSWGAAHFLNCVFSGNTLAGQTTSEAYCALDNAVPVAFVNTVFRNDADGYEPFAYNAVVPFMAAYCRIPGYTAEKYADRLGTYGFDIGNSAQIPNVESSAKKGANGAWAVTVKGVPSCGAPVYIGSDGLPYAYIPALDAAKPYLRVNTGLSNLKFATVPGLSTGTASVNCDAYGARPTSHRNKPALGPVNYPAGLMLLVK